MSVGTILAVLAVAEFVGAVAITAQVRRYALARNLLDTANERSSHTVPTPRGGGLSIVLASLIGLAVALGPTSLSGPVAAALLAGGAAVAAIGWIDDHGHIRPLARLAAHTGAAIWAVAWLGPIDLFDYGLPPALSGASVAWPVSVLMVAWLLNLFNFMDGIDGLAGSEAVLVAGGSLAVLWASSSSLAPGLAAPFALLAASAAGFLVWNWPPARIFMGDAGSGFVGYWIACLVLLADGIGPAASATVLILAGVFVVDATVTLLHRLAQGDRVFEAHRTHAYQRLARRCGRHLPVTLGSIAVTVIFLGPLAWLVAAGHLAPLAGLACAYLPLALAAWLAGAGKPGD
jgi:Fuc2NAc and GlcNAc transferase